MKRGYIILFVLLTNTLFSQDTIYFDSDWKKSDQTNAIYCRVDQKSNEHFIRKDYFYSNWQLQMIGEYESFNPEMRIGEFKWYHKNGVLKHVGKYEKNKEIGTHKWYYESGTLEAIENYTQGIYDGEYKEYHENGLLSVLTSFSNGKQNGMTKYYREDGTLQSEGIFESGNRSGIWTFYDEQEKLLGTKEYKVDYVIEEADMFLKLPNTKWGLNKKIEGDLTQYYFKREPIVDSKGMQIIPAIMVLVEDAAKYGSDVTVYSIEKRIPYLQNGVKINRTLIHDNDGFPLTYKNAYFMECQYMSDGEEHIFYMIHIINKNNKGIQIYLDMTKDLYEKYVTEFWTTIESIREN